MSRKPGSPSSMTIDEIRELIQVVTETSVAELEVQRGEEVLQVGLALRRLI